MTADPNDPVAVQYERWPYPAPSDDLTTFSFESPASHYWDLRDLYWAYWPTAAYRDDLSVLVAGCGSTAAACYAYLYPRARVVGIDVSATSLAHEESLRRKHDLQNLTLYRCRVEDAASLQCDFDFVSVHGVLHHLADPVAGLRALGDVLRRHGVIAVMVYAPYARTGVYMLQEFFRVLDLQQTAADVQVVKDTLGVLPASHQVRPYLHRAFDLASDPGLVDTFLHRRDRAYSVSQSLDLVEAAGLTFQGWDENGFYYPDLQVPAHLPLRARLEQLPGPRLWQAMELFDGGRAMHWFHVCRKDRDPADYRVHFQGEAFLDYLPVPRVKHFTPADPARGQPATIARPPCQSVALDPTQAAVFSRLDGQRSVRQCLLAAGLRSDQPDQLAFARTFLASLWRAGYLLFRLPTPALPSGPTAATPPPAGG